MVNNIKGGIYLHPLGFPIDYSGFDMNLTFLKPFHAYRR